MQTLKKIMNALLLISILPWSNLAAASAATGDIGGSAYFSDEAAIVQRLDVTEMNFTAPLKSKRVAALQLAQCGANAQLLSGTDHLLFSSGNVQWVLGNLTLTPRCAQAPPTSPPRSV